MSDAKLRKMIKELEFVDDKSKKPVKLYDAGISSIDIERRFDNDKVRVTVTLNVAKPGIVIGANGANIEKIKAAIVKELGAKNAQVILNVQEIKNPDLDAQLVAENIAAQLENRVSFPPRDEEVPAELYARWREGHQDQRGRPSGARGYRAQRGLPRGFYPAADPACRH